MVKNKSKKFYKKTPYIIGGVLILLFVAFFVIASSSQDALSTIKPPSGTSWTEDECKKAFVDIPIQGRNRVWTSCRQDFSASGTFRTWYIQDDWTGSYSGASITAIITNYQKFWQQQIKYSLDLNYCPDSTETFVKRYKVGACQEVIYQQVEVIVFVTEEVNVTEYIEVPAYKEDSAWTKFWGKVRGWFRR